MGEGNAGIAFNPSGYSLMVHTKARAEENGGEFPFQHSGMSINGTYFVALLGFSTQKQLSVPSRLVTYV